ncbi:MAG TPA: type II CAAX endopeptidase family protein [Phycisphaerae bacterium]|nr:type II CAAX endopeptidase family protein [Phycisphaerae bacterium]
MTVLGYSSEKEFTPPWRVREFIAWAVIVAVVALVLILSPRSAGRKTAAPETPDLRMILAARYMVGMTHVLPTASQKAEHLDETLASSAKSPGERLEVAIVRGELEGKAAALKEIDSAETADPSVRKDAEILRGIYAGTPPATGPDLTDFKQRHGWFADLAESYGKPATDPLRAATVEKAVRTMIVAILVLLFAGLAGLVGLVLLITGIIMWFTGHLRTHFGQVRLLPVNRAAHVEAVAWYLSIYVVGSLLLGLFVHLFPGLNTKWGLLLLPAGFGVAVLWPRMQGESWAEWRAAVGLHTGQGVFKELACGAAGYLAGLPVLALGLLASALISKWSGADPTHPIMREINGDPKRIVLLLLLASVWAPITEELMFRGSLFAHLRERWGWWRSALLVSLVFAIIHPQGLAALPALGSIAMMLAMVREWRGSILGCVMAHAINNTIVLLTLVLMVT